MKKFKLSRKILSCVLALACILSSVVAVGAKESAASFAPGETAHVNLVYAIYADQGYMDFGFLMNTGGVTPAKYTGYFINESLGVSDYFESAEPRVGKMISVNTDSQYYIAVSALDQNGNQIGYMEQRIAYPYDTNAVYSITSDQGYLDFGWHINTRFSKVVEYNGYLINESTGSSEYFSVTEPRLGKRISLNSADQYYIAIAAMDAYGNRVGYLEQRLSYPYESTLR